MKIKRRFGFSLIELLVVVGIIAMLLAILMPALKKAKRHVRVVLGTNNKRQIVTGVNIFAFDNNDKYPESVATIGTSSFWNWQEPTMLIGYRKRSPQMHRSVSAYLRGYIEQASIMFSPSAPRRYKYLDEAWEAGDNWNNPETVDDIDPVSGTYCFYWGYIGYLGGKRERFIGPRTISGGQGQSKLLMTDYFGYNHWRSRNAYGSCEKFKAGGVTPERHTSSAYWSCSNSAGNVNLKTLGIKLHAGYVDGHVSSFMPSETVPMEVSISADGRIPYPRELGLGPGIFYLPRNGLR